MTPLGIDSEVKVPDESEKESKPQDVQRWYREYLAEYEGAEYDPTRKLTNPYDIPEADNHALSAGQVQSLFQAAERFEEELTVIGLAGWGPRRKEVASLHVSQLHLEGDDPYIEFKERKNADSSGPSTVALIFGLEEVARRLDTLMNQAGMDISARLQLPRAGIFTGRLSTVGSAGSPSAATLR